MLAEYAGGEPRSRHEEGEVEGEGFELPGGVLEPQSLVVVHLVQGLGLRVQGLGSRV
jgi:hypothetical protein